MHDDFYDDDGTATQPEEDVVKPAAFLIPRLADVQNDTDLLLDYTITRWSLSDEISVAWSGHSSDVILDCLERRFNETTNVGVRSVILDITAVALKADGANFVRSVWLHFPASSELRSLVRASATCLPFDEAFNKATGAIDSLPIREHRGAMNCLSYFQSPATLDWIEQHAGEPITDAWGDLAAASAFSWDRAEKWLSVGRPLSLIAIDALLSIANPRTPLLKSMQPPLLGTPTELEFREVLTNYASLDKVPRIQQRVTALLNCAEKLCLNG